MKVTLEEMPDAVRELARPWPSLVGEIPDLTAELEKEFRFGQRVIHFGGRYRLGGNIKGGSSSIWAPSDRSHYDCYLHWQSREGIPETENRAAYDRLVEFLKERGVEVSNGNYPAREQERHRYCPRWGFLYDITLGILRRLPPQHLEGGHLRHLQLGGWGPDSAKGSAYESGMVLMYDFALEGARRTYCGLLLHELGHAHESALPSDCREEIRRRYEVLRQSSAVLGVEYLLDAETRRLYQLRFFDEFLAELYLIYTSQGTRLREFVAGLRGEVREAWDGVYAGFQESFGGVEYS